MKGLIVYDTSYGNTRTIADLMVETLRESRVETDLFYVKDVRKLDGNDYDFLVIGSPTRFGTMSLTIRTFLGKVKSEEWLNKYFVAFDTENPENLGKNEGSAAEKIAGKLREKRMIELLPVLKALVIGMNGPLVAGEINRTRDYSMELARKLSEGKSSVKLESISA